LPWPMVRDLPPAVYLVYFYAIFGKKFIRNMYIFSGRASTQRIDRIVFEDEHLVWLPFDLYMFRHRTLHTKSSAVQHHSEAAKLGLASFVKAYFHLCILYQAHCKAENHKRF